jgi:hypothetical protein
VINFDISDDVELVNALPNQEGDSGTMSEEGDKRQANLITASLTRLRRGAVSFNRDERGLKVVEMLLLIFVAAIILIGFLKVFFPEVLEKVKARVMELLGMEVG